MDVFEEIADERRALALQLADLTPQQQASPSLCRPWTVHDVAAHLVMPLEVSTARLVLAVLRERGRFDRANVRVTARLARRPFTEIVDVLHRRAHVRFTPPGGGPEAPLLDVLVHGSDIRWPLGLHREVPEPRLVTALRFVGTAPAGLVPRGALAGLRLEAEDVGFAQGRGPVVRGPAQALLLAATGRAVALEVLHGPGVGTLRARLAAA
ncbi:maleylpyruvate isomerase family mycothiol-dependent enzyme [Cellulomonas endophytica]|uniref:maleylpyruvate isomerase family mycothiol-dependent enzyme n=1 Tax=Cellulomonas endophytica TaxID=2494735 RepID=UPI001010B1FA|nr:maleylpyruvate isomerase family mycothiol-dependent enzyme [Cellulomonas endophytica]